MPLYQRMLDLSFCTHIFYFLPVIHHEVVPASTFSLQSIL